jgi:hypothetical protein
MAKVNGEYFALIGGARLNLMNATFPCAELEVFPDALRLACLGKDCVPAEQYRRSNKIPGSVLSWLKHTS